MERSTQQSALSIQPANVWPEDAASSAWLEVENCSERSVYFNLILAKKGMLSL